MKVLSMRKCIAAAMCVLAVAGECFGGLVLSCDTAEQIVGIGTNAQIPSGSTNYTIELWFKPSHVYSSGEYRMLGQFSGTAGRMLVAYRNGKVGVFNGGGNAWTTCETVLSANTWYHFAAVFDGSSANKTAVYLNGVLEGSNTTASVGINNRYISIGGATASRVTSGTNREYEAFDGRIADVRIWTTARSQEEIVANYQSRLAGDETGLRAYWPLDAVGDDGQTVTEALSGVRSVLPSSHYTLVEDDDLVLTSVESRAAGVQAASSTSGSTMRGLQTDITTSLGSSFTIETWVRPKSGNTSERWILDQYNGGKGRFIFATQGNKPSFFVGGSTSGHVIADDELSVEKWTHLALTRDGDDFTLYTNGYVAVAQTVSGAYLAPDVPFAIGSTYLDGTVRGAAFIGSQREVRLWSVCRTAEEIRETMGRTLLGNESNLRGYWPIDEGLGSNVLNRVTGVACNVVNFPPVWETTDCPPVAHTPGPNLESAPSFGGSCHTGGDTGLKITTSDYTLEAWIRVVGENYGDAYVASQFNSSSTAANMMFGVVDNYLTHMQDGHETTKIIGATPIPRNRWTHVAYVQSGSNRKLYVDGELDAEVDDGVVAVPISTEQLRIGYVSHSPGAWRRYSLDGSLADVRLWNCARTAKEIATYRTHRLHGYEGGLVGCWPLDDGANGVMTNIVRNGVQGEIFAIWNSLDDLSFEDPLKLGFSITVR